MTDKRHRDLILAWLDGAEIEIYDNGEEGWSDIPDPTWVGICEYRIKTSPKKVDLSKLIESGIDCEFWDGYGARHNGKLRHIATSGSPKYVATDIGEFLNCQPRMNHIHYWGGGECPLPEGFRLRLHHRSGVSSAPTLGYEIPKAQWCHVAGGLDIIGFEIMGIAEGFSL